MSTNIDEIREELNTMLNEAEEIYDIIYDVSTHITTIDEGDAKLRILYDVIPRTRPIILRLIELNATNPEYSKINDTFIDEMGGDYEVVLFDEINRYIEPIENMFIQKTEILTANIDILGTVGSARMIQEDEDKLHAFNEQIINQSTCPICISRVVNIRIDCGHLFCSNCVLNIDECPLCKREIKHLDKIYLKKYLKYRTKYLLLKNKINK
jgi:hypothetical protein